MDGVSLTEKDKEEYTETIMTKEFVQSAVSLITDIAQEVGMNRSISTAFGDESKEESNRKSQGDDYEGEIYNENATINGPEVLVINHKRVKKIQNLEEYTNLRRLSLIDN